MGVVVASLLVGLPLVGAVVAWRLRAPNHRAALLLAVAALHVVGVLFLWRSPGGEVMNGWLGADDLGLLVVTLVSILFFVVSAYAVGARRHAGAQDGRLFVACLLGFLAAASTVALSRHLALLWVAMEGTTLALAPLVYDRRDRRSLEAVWKYLVLSSVGIAFALLAVFLVATAQPVLEGTRPLIISDLVAAGGALDREWLRLAMVFALIGFGTKMGLAPLHSWKPDVYGEAPVVVGGLMAGVTTACAFVGVARFTEVAAAAGILPFVRPLLIAFGLVSLVVAAAFILGQPDVKRLLAYSSIEHMGLLVLGIGVGGAGAYGTVFHLVNNALVKGALFLVTGNLIAAAGTPVIADMSGSLRVKPASALVFVAGLLAVTGAPPFGTFLSEFTIVAAALHEHHPWVAGAVILLLTVIFVGIAATVVAVACGAPQSRAGRPARREAMSAVVGPAVLAAAVLALGVYLPPPVRETLLRAARALGGHGP